MDVHKDIQSQSSPRINELFPDLCRQPAEAMLNCTYIVLWTVIFRAYFVALSPDSSDEFVFLGALL